ncbi:MAG: hypothetical protein JWN76_1247 [Chitinophagaceae bacterium]|nr:hypothetical protein [Chitinophagaceae bacterium]
MGANTNSGGFFGQIINMGTSAAGTALGPGGSDLVNGLINAFGGISFEHSAEWSYDNGLDKMTQAISDPGHYANSSAAAAWFKNEVLKARAGVKGLIAKKAIDYADGSVLYYLPMLAGRIQLGAADIAPDNDLLKMVEFYQGSGAIPSGHMSFEKRPNWNIPEKGFVPSSLVTKWTSVNAAPDVTSTGGSNLLALGSGLFGALGFSQSSVGSGTAGGAALNTNKKAGFNIVGIILMLGAFCYGAYKFCFDNNKHYKKPK